MEVGREARCVVKGLGKLVVDRGRKEDRYVVEGVWWQGVFWNHQQRLRKAASCVVGGGFIT